VDAAYTDALRRNYEEALRHSNALTDHISTDQFSAEYVDPPDWAIGPFRRDPALTFRLDGQWDDPTGVGWTSSAIFNPTLIERDGELHLFYRASPRMESTASRIVLFYNAIRRTDEGETAVDIMGMVSDDLVSWEKIGLVVPLEVSLGWAKGAVVPRDEHGRAVRIGGEYLMYLSEGCGGRPTIGHSDDLVSWTFTEQPYLDLSPLPGSLFEVACAVVRGDDLVLDFFYADENGDFAAAQAHYTVDAPFTQLGLHRGGSLAWGGLQRLDGRWSFAQGWDAPRGERELYIYKEVTK